ncbi:uncharacterized protein [Clytia hemisphaerica]|uniref:Uncharacterized protein n=1 Tax=Clytia hemisphaerica TaxID=252671 RepID=A0A7M5XKE6_9CNID
MFYIQMVLSTSSKEVGSYHVSTDSGTLTLGIADMYSGEAQSYLEETKAILTLMSETFPSTNAESVKYKLIHSIKVLMTDRTIGNLTFHQKFQRYREGILPEVIENYNLLPEEEKKDVSTIHHLFCGLHIIHNLGVYAENALIEWEKAVEEEGSTHGGFQKATKSRTYSLLYELSKLTTYNHGDQKSGKAEEWRAFLKKREIVDRMVSFMHHRFNIIFVLGGAAYYHKDQLSEFASALDGTNFLHTSVKQDIDNQIFLASNRALGVFNKMVSGPLFRILEEEGHIFLLNSMWKDLSDYLELCSRDASSMLEGKTFFEEKYVTSNCNIYKALFRETEDPLLDCLTQECLEIICCSCSIMVRSQLKDQLPGGKYFQPSEKIVKETTNCPRHNLAPERAFASLDRILSMKPNMTTLAVAGAIMYSQNKTNDWLLSKSEEEIKFLIAMARKNKRKLIKENRSKRAKILQYKIDSMDRKKVEKEIKVQKISDEKEIATKNLDKVGGLLTDKIMVEKICEAGVKEATNNLQAQVAFRKKVLQQSFSNRKLLQLGEKGEKGYKKYDLETLKTHLCNIFDELSNSPAERARDVFCRVKENDPRQEKLKKLKEELNASGDARLVKEISSSKKVKINPGKESKIPTFLCKRIKHKWDDDGFDKWFEGNVITVLDDDEFDDECEFQVAYDGFEDPYVIQVVKEWRMNCIIVLGSIPNKEVVDKKKEKKAEEKKTKTKTKKLKKSLK